MAIFPKFAGRNRPKGLPELGQQHHFPVGRNDRAGERVPYRLPKVPTPRDGGETPRKLVMMLGATPRSNNGLSVETIPLSPPKTFSQECRRANLSLPKFRQAVVAPVRDKSVVPVYFSNSPGPEWYQRFRMPDDLNDEPEGVGPVNTPYHRTPSPTKSVNWTLSPHKHGSFDKKGKGHVQGPFSREFTVTCSAPTNWLRMKLGRSKTTLV